MGDAVQSLGVAVARSVLYNEELRGQAARNRVALGWFSGLPEHELTPANSRWNGVRVRGEWPVSISGTL